MIKSHSRGWEIYFDGKDWRYSDNGKLANDSRPCKRCGRMPTKEGTRTDLTSSPNGEKVKSTHTDKELAKMAGVGTGTYSKGKKSLILVKKM